MYDFSYTPQGWQCPVCKRVYSPSTLMCLYCGGDKVNVTTGSNVGTTATPVGIIGDTDIPIYPLKVSLVEAPEKEKDNE